jgi:aspartyl-tRNA synthetase
MTKMNQHIITWQDRTGCGDVSATHIGSTVLLMGWVDALRDHGDLLFIHLRDRSGMVQVVFNPEKTSSTICSQAASLRNEYCIAVRGQVIDRLPGTENPNIETGKIEVIAQEMEVLSRSQTLPFIISEKAMVSGAQVQKDSVSEDLRLQYRYLDLRRPSMQDCLMKRHLINRCVRQYLDEEGFIEIETPMLTKSTPEGARDYLVPSRIHQQCFYALPQSPQLFKQLLMVSGFERYYQIVRCFRDEDLRPNRQPEFTQLDLEASFIDEEFIYRLIEEITVRMFAVGGIDLPRPFPRITYQEAIDSTGTDRPDLRFGLTFVDVTDVFRNTSYSIFRQILQRGGCIKGINIKSQSEKLSKNVLQNEYAKEIVPSFGAKGMTWMRVMDQSLESNIVQFFTEEEQQAVMKRYGAENGDVIIMIADPSYEVVTSALGMLRLHLADRLDLVPQNVFHPVWITDFPLFEALEEGITSIHHPFTAPDRADFDPENREELLSLRSRAYDLVINGEELGGGSIRINDKELQQKIFKALGLSEKEVQDKFGFFLQALDYGAPPHGGLALGMDRVVSMILRTPSIREVIAFPKNRSAYCPLTEAPSAVQQDQLAELGLLDLGVATTIPGTVKEKDVIDTLSWVSRIAIDDTERPSVSEAIAAAERLADLVGERAGTEEPIYTVVPVSNRYRKDQTVKRSSFAENEEIFKNAPAVKGRFFKVASILE